MEYLKEISKIKYKQTNAKKNIHICKRNKYDFCMKKTLAFTAKLIIFKRPNLSARYSPSRRSLRSHLKVI